MSDRRASTAMDRLPWLDDEPNRANRVLWNGLRRWAPAIVGAAILIAGGSYWLGRETAQPIEEDRPAVATELGKGEATMDLPDAQKVVEEVVATAPPELAQQSEQSQPAPPPPVVRHGRVDIRRKASVSPKPVADNKVEFWSAMTSAGASGRMVRIGTFSNRKAAKRGWRAIIGIYPGMKRVPAAVVPLASARDGRTYYRLQMGTTSQAHSEVLCQRMKIIGQSCVVVGLAEARQAATKPNEAKTATTKPNPAKSNEEKQANGKSEAAADTGSSPKIQGPPQ